MRALLEYWEKSFLDGFRMGLPTDKVIGADSIQISRQDYLSGKPMARAYQKIVEKYSAIADAHPKDNQLLPILIFPCVYIPKATHQQRSTRPSITAICFPANLAVNTRILSPRPTDLPFVPRRHLRPMESGFTTIGDVETIDKFFTDNSYSPTSWSDAVAFVQNLVATIMITENETVSIEGTEYMREDFVYIVVPKPGELSNGPSIQKLYAELLASNKTLPLLSLYAQLSTPQQSKKPLIDIKGHVECMPKHLGQMNCQFGLSPSQREAIHHYLSCGDGTITAINGPPGTGKTTLLQSVVSTAWVAAALRGDSQPPITVACSTNNQAVTNIIESFGTVSASIGILGERWLPGVTSYGLYCVSASKTTKPEYQRLDDFPSKIENEIYVEEGKLFFLEKANSHYSRIFESLEKVSDRLKNDLQVAAQNIENETDKLRKLCAEKETALDSLRRDKADALKCWVSIGELEDILCTIQTRISSNSLKLSENQAVIFLKEEELSRLVAIIEPLAKRLNRLKDIIRKWEVRSRTVPLGIRFLFFLSYFRDKWVVQCLDFFALENLDAVISSDACEAIHKGITTVYNRVNATSDIDLALYTELQLLKTELEQKSAEPEKVSVALEGLKTELQEKSNKLAEDKKTEANIAKRLNDNRGSLNLIITRQKIFTCTTAEDISAAFDKLLENVEQAFNDKINVMYNSFSERLDKDTRSRMFSLATHYWESKWLLEMKAGFQSGGDFPSNRKNSQHTKDRLLRYAKLTPLFVSTFHMAPTNFAAWKRGPDDKPSMEPLYEFIDLLIVDEAGQVGPDIAAPTFALAKKALVVGDLYQIEPVWSVNQPVDIGNFQRALGKETAAPYTEMGNIGCGVSAASGSVMRIAQMCSSYMTDKDTPGLLLREHRRCAPQIIQYCNDLAYKGKLIPCREEPKKKMLPFMGWAHISGVCKKLHDSRVNEREAEVIVAWIIGKRSALEDFYGVAIENIVAIVTPFTPQATLLRRLLKKSGLADITAGTVHSLQGAEKKVVILSTVYDINTCGNRMFFDDGVNMLNVAVSRAVDSFLVFGDTRILNLRKRTPSGMLAKVLFSTPENEITDLPFNKSGATRPRLSNVLAESISTLDGHRQALYEAITSARQRVIICSPWITHKAILADNLIEPITSARGRDVSIIIYTDRDFNCEAGCNEFNKSFREGIKALTTAGAEVRIVERVHNKDLVIDSSTLICGSFNWLSAVRDAEHYLSKKNRSLKLTGVEVPELVVRVVEEMEFMIAGKYEHPTIT